MFVFAQLSTSVSDGQIRLIILALLGVAVLLGLLTAWYAVKTSPRRRVKAAQARRGSATDTGRSGGESPTSARANAAATARAGAASPSASAGRTVAQPVAEIDDDDEWTRLTAPHQQRSTNG